MKTHMVEAAVTHMIAGTKIAVDAPAVSMLPVGNGDVQSEGGIESIWIREKKAKEAAIAASGGSISRATKRLQVAPSAIYRKIQSRACYHTVFVGSRNYLQRS